MNIIEAVSECIRRNEENGISGEYLWIRPVGWKTSALVPDGTYLLHVPHGSRKINYVLDICDIQAEWEVVSSDIVLGERYHVE